MQQGRGNRRGINFTIRLTEDERAELLDAQRAVGGPIALGPWLVWAATSGAVPRRPARALPELAAAGAVPDLALEGALPSVPPRERLILDLCAGSGAWSEPYAQAGYRVERVDLPRDVRTYVPPLDRVWGVLCAPPCTHFSLARRDPPDFVAAMACVNACLRIIFQVRPQWWALENPTGLIGKWLGRPRDVWQPCDFGDAWTKRTALWGEFTRPERRHVRPVRSWGPDIGARTPPGFARAFYEANP